MWCSCWFTSQQTSPGGSTPTQLPPPHCRTLGLREERIGCERRGHRDTAGLQWTKPSQSFLRLEPLTRPKRSRKLHVGTQMNPAHVTSAGEDERDTESTDVTCISGTGDDSKLYRQKECCVMSTRDTWAVWMGILKDTDEGRSVCVCPVHAHCVYVCVGVWFLFPWTVLTHIQAERSLWFFPISSWLTAVYLWVCRHRPTGASDSHTHIHTHTHMHTHTAHFLLLYRDQPPKTF